MSYDLILRTAKRRRPDSHELDALHSRVSQSAVLGRCEVLDFIAEGKAHLVTVCLTSDEAIAEAAYAELKVIAREFKLNLHDPQAGADVDLDSHGRLPAMY